MATTTLPLATSHSDEGVAALASAQYVLSSIPPVAALLYDPVSAVSKSSGDAYVCATLETVTCASANMPLLVQMG